MNVKSFIIFTFLLYSIYTFISETDNFIINFVDYNMTISNYIRPIISDDGYLYIVTGEILNKTYNPGSTSFKRCIFKFNEKTGKIQNSYSYSSKYPFQNGEVIISGNNMKYLLTTTINSIEFYNGKELFETDYNVYDSRRAIKRIGDYFYYAHQEPKNSYLMIIDKIKISENDIDLPSYFKKEKVSNPINVFSSIGIISCDSTKDGQYILCAYFNEKLVVIITIFDNNFEIIKTEKKEICNNADQNYFIKIIYYKDLNKFIMINSVDNNIARLRFFKYINNKIVDQLSPIIDDYNQYLDVSESQDNPYQYSNDIISVDNNRFIKVCSGNDKIIITLFQFYENDTLLHIKIYNINYNTKLGFSGFIHPRISMFKNSLVLCISTFYEGTQRAGYSFFNFPNSKDFVLTDNKISFKDNLFIENNLFSLNLKYKILEIPNDFKLIDSNTLKEIKENEELEINNEILLKQYKINGEYTLKYTGIAIGYDLGYLSSKVYPISRNISEDTKIYKEGREGNIIIKLDYCLNGYYPFCDNLTLCVNEKPEGYYFDDKEKCYRHCQKPCYDCSKNFTNNTYMNCDSCIKNYNITEDTKSCYDYMPNNYYLDNNIYRRCHPRCLTCIKGSKNNSNMNCLNCESGYGYFYKSDTHNCILSSEFEKRKEKDLRPKYSGYFILFIIIFIISCIFSGLTLFKEVE